MNTEHKKQKQADWEDAAMVRCDVMAGDKVVSVNYGIGVVLPILGRHRGCLCVDFGIYGKIEISADELQYYRA